MAGSKAPELGSEWWITDAMKDNAAQEVTSLNLRTTELRAKINGVLIRSTRSPESRSQILKLMQQARNMVTEFDAWADSIPDLWKIRTVAWMPTVAENELETAAVYPGRVDFFDDIWVASVWNVARVSRLFLSGIIVRCAAWVCAPNDYRTTPEYAREARFSANIVEDIIATVPYHLGWKVDDHDALMSRPNMSGFACGDDNEVGGKGLSAHFLVWPLFSAACSDFTTDVQRRWIMGRLRHIAGTMGINQADVLSHVSFPVPRWLDLALYASCLHWSTSLCVALWWSLFDLWCTVVSETYTDPSSSSSAFRQ